LGKTAEEPVEIGAGVAPVERDRGLLVAGLEGQQSALELGEVGEVVGGQHLALQDREGDLDLVQPGRVDRQVDKGQVRPRP
jgi:hypothetical protein